MNFIKELHLKNLLSGHMLEGFAHSKSFANYGEHWKAQFITNQIAKKCLIELGFIFKNNHIQPCLLKGFSLLGHIYLDWGSRFASDVDLLIEKEELHRAHLSLLLGGFKSVHLKKWKGDDFKYIYEKTMNGVTITIELHTRLFWHTKANISSYKSPSQTLMNYTTLDAEMQLVHLCGHYGFQHTFLKLFWLVDIIQSVQMTNIDWDRFNTLSRLFNLKKSCYFSLYAARAMGSQDKTQFISHNSNGLSYIILRHLVTRQFLLAPKKHLLLYLLVKALIKDSALQSLQYSALSILFKMKSFLSHRETSN